MTILRVFGSVLLLLGLVAGGVAAFFMGPHDELIVEPADNFTVMRIFLFFAIGSAVLLIGGLLALLTPARRS